MKSSSCSGSSLRSDQSNILTLSSNKSQSLQINKTSQLQMLRQKLSNLFQVDSDNVQDLYLAIEDKYSKKFVHETLTELNSVLSNLGKIKKNNREMAKLVSSLGVKLQDKENLDRQENQRTSTTEQSKNVQTNQASTSYEEYHFEYQPVKPIYSPENPQFQVTNSYKEYQTNNKKYEQRIIQMLNELGNIKAEIRSKKQMESKPAINKIKYPEPQVIQSKDQRPKYNQQVEPAESYKSIAERYLFVNGQNQKSLYVKASQISKRLQEIKNKIQGIKTQQKQDPIQIPYQKYPNQANQQNIKSNNLKANSTQKSVRFQSEQSSASQSNRISMGFVEQKSHDEPVLQRHRKKKSLLDHMNNVQSKMIISDKQINHKDTLIDLFKQTNSQDSSPDQQSSNIRRKDSTLKKSSGQNNLMQKSSVKQILISYSNMSNSNSIGENSKEYFKNISYHNTSIMNPHYVTKNKHPQNPINIQKKQYTFEKNSSFISSPITINLNRNNSQQRLDNRSYSRQHSIKLVPSQPILPLIQDIRPVKQLGHSQSALNISMKNLNNRLESPFPQRSSQSIHQQRHTQPLIPLQPQYRNHPLPPGYHVTQQKMVNPFDNLNQDMHERQRNSLSNTTGFYNMSRNSSFYQQTHSKAYETQGINLSVLKPSPDSSLLVTLGKPSGHLRDSTYSRDSRDSKRGKGVRLSNEFS